MQPDPHATMVDDFSDVITELRRTFDSGVSRSLGWRRGVLGSLRRLYEENTDAMVSALLSDLGGGNTRVIGELLGVPNIDMALSQLEEWTADRPARHDWALGRSFIRPEPKGVVLIISAWNFPIKELLEPLVGALAAGNVALLKPSELSPATASLLAQLVPQYLPPNAVRLVQGGVPETTALLELQFDHIVYTGSTRVGKVVMAAAARHLTPVTLECGGKCPVFIDRTAKIRLAVARMLLLKYVVNCGQVCVAPDYVLVDQEVEKEFLDEWARQAEAALGTTKAQMWHGDVARQTYGRILNAEHVQRLSAMAAESGGRLVLGRLDAAEPESGFFPPVCVSRPADGSPLLTHEVFGPILSVVPVDGVDEAIRKYRSICRSPLAVYVFSEDAGYVRRVLQSTSSGMVAVNDAGPGSFGLDLPFGGVGSSGIGAYGGRAGFEQLSHHRAVLVRSTAPFLPQVDVPPPSLGKVPGWLYGLALRLLLTGFFPRSLRPVLKPAVVAAGVLAAWRVLRRWRGAMVGAEMLRWLAAALGGVAQMMETTAQHPG